MDLLANLVTWGMSSISLNYSPVESLFLFKIRKRSVQLVLIIHFYNPSESHEYAIQIC